MRPLRVPLTAVVLCLAAFAVRLPAQSHILKTITFTGAPASSQAELLAFTGLNPGDSATQQQVDDAAQRLNDLGLFSEVTFAGDDKGIVFALQPAARTAMLPIHYANLLWWSDDELSRLLQPSLPLFRPAAVPIAGTMRKAIADRLQVLLAAKGVANAGVVSHRAGFLNDPSKGPSGGSHEMLAFVLDSPPVLVHALTLTGVSPAIAPAVNEFVKETVGQPWDSATDGFVAHGIANVYLDQGYLDIAVPKQTHSGATITPSSIDLDLTATVAEGTQYHVARLDWPGSPMLSASDFAAHATLKPGAADSPAGLKGSLRVITIAYANQGYLDARVLAPPTIDRSAHTVAYAITVDPGPQYHLKAVHFAGSDAQQKDLAASWRMKPGDVFNDGYLVTFAQQNQAYRKQGLNFSFKQQRNADLTIDLTVSLAKAPPPK